MPSLYCYIFYTSVYFSFHIDIILGLIYSLLSVASLVGANVPNSNTQIGATQTSDMSTFTFNRVFNVLSHIMSSTPRYAAALACATVSTSLLYLLYSAPPICTTKCTCIRI